VGPSWGHRGPMEGPWWGHGEAMVRLWWGHRGTIVWPWWDHRGAIVGPSRCHRGVWTVLHKTHEMIVYSSFHCTGRNNERQMTSRRVKIRSFEVSFLQELNVSYTI
jgi:hypothetical protein